MIPIRLGIITITRQKQLMKRHHLTIFLKSIFTDAIIAKTETPNPILLILSATTKAIIPIENCNSIYANLVCFKQNDIKKSSADVYNICKQEIIRTYSKSPIFAKLCLNES
ncbi:hypothetical protein AALC75_23945 [Lachnospiraceae bacterium 48-42]